VIDRAYFAIDHQYKKSLSNYMAAIDIRWPWRSLTTITVGYLSDSWDSCTFVVTVIFEYHLQCQGPE